MIPASTNRAITGAYMTVPACRFCGADLTQTLVDLGLSPLANSYVAESDLGRPDPRYPLHARICPECMLVQVDEVVRAEEIFSDYAYFSSYSDTWVAHAKAYAEMAIARFRLDGTSRVAEIASNDGYLLQHFVAKEVPVLGIEPAANVAEVALAKGIPTEVAFFGRETANRLASGGVRADLIAANNVLAHVPAINDFVAGVPILLKPDGVFTVEFQHLINIIQKVQFDTIYHEHFSYLSLLATEKLYAAHGLRVFDVEELPTHGGSLRVFACLQGCDAHAQGPGLEIVRSKESSAGLHRLDVYEGFEGKVQRIRSDLLGFLGRAKAEAKRVCAYGAAAKGNTLLNYCGIGPDDIDFVVDRNPVKQGRYLPGSRIPIKGPEAIDSAMPDYILILPWNLRDEIVGSMAHCRDWGARFVVPIPALEILD